MRNILSSLVVATALLASTAHSSESTMRPGLWEVKTSSDLLKLASQIPPDQMQQLMSLAKQNGFELPPIRDGAAISSVCITQKMADQKSPLDFLQNQSGCSAKDASHVGSKYKLNFVCANANLRGNGTAEGTFTNPESFSGRTEFDGVAQGNPVNEHADVNGRWVGASCGTVRPAQ